MNSKLALLDDPDRVDKMDGDQLRAEISAATGMNDGGSNRAPGDDSPEAIKIHRHGEVEEFEWPEPIGRRQKGMRHLVRRRVGAQAPDFDLPSGRAKSRQRVKKVLRRRTAVFEMRVDPEDRLVRRHVRGRQALRIHFAATSAYTSASLRTWACQVKRFALA